MLSKGKSSGTAALRRDVFLSVLIGPVGTAIPALGYLLLFPIIIHRSGLVVLGVWSLLSSFSVYVHTTDVGFSLLINREAGRDRTRGELAEIHRDRIAARRLYSIIGVILLGILLAGQRYIFIYFGNSYPADGLFLASLILVFGTTLEITAKLDAAVIAARSHTFVVHLVKSLITLLALIAAVSGALLDKPLEGFALGRVLKGISELTIYRWWLVNRHPEWLDARATLPYGATWGRIRALAVRGWQLSAISWLGAIWGALIRVVIGSVAGLPAVGVFEIAMRMISAISNALTMGFGALFPALAQLHRLDDRTGTINLIRESLFYLLGLGAGILGIFAVTSGKIILLWLGDLPEGVVFASQVLAVLQIVRLLGVPYYFFLQSVGRQAFISLGTAIQILSFLPLIPLGRVIDLGLEEILVYWGGVSVCVNGLTLWLTEKHTRCFVAVIRDDKVKTLLGAALFVIGGIFLLPSLGRADGEGFWSSETALVGGFFLTYGVFVLAVLWSRVKANVIFLRPKYPKDGVPNSGMEEN